MSACLCPEQKSILPPVSFKVTSHTGAWQQPPDLDLSDLILSAFLPCIFTQHLPPQCLGQTSLLFLERRRQTGRSFPPPQIYFAVFLSPAEGRSRNMGTWKPRSSRKCSFSHFLPPWVSSVRLSGMIFKGLLRALPVIWNILPPKGRGQLRAKSGSFQQ